MKNPRAFYTQQKVALEKEALIREHLTHPLIKEIRGKGLMLAAVTKRHAVEDVLIARKQGTTIVNLKEGAVVATGSLRRKCQLMHLRPDIKVVDLRGNVPSRIKKFLKSNWDAIILARAGVERLNLKKHISSYISTELILPAVGQGALGIEINSANKRIWEIIQSVNDETAFSAVRVMVNMNQTGEAAGVAAYLAIQGDMPIQKIDPAAIRKTLADGGSAIV